MYSNDLIYGKNKFERIVSIEARDELLEIFTEEKNGQVLSTFRDNVYWLLTSKSINSSFIKLDGDLHYKYAKTFRDRKDFFKYKQYLKAKDIDFYAVGDSKEAIMLRDGYTYFKGMTPKDVSVLSFDLETTGLNHDDEAKILLISITYRNSIGDINKVLFSYDSYKSQGEMLNAFCEYVRFCNPSIIIGHNIESFDLPYMQYIADRENVTLDLGRDSSAIKFDNYESKFRKDGSQFYTYNKAHIYGREIVDTLFLSIKYDATARSFESYGLKNIIKQLKLEKPDRVYYDASKIRDNYQIPEEWKKIKKYCIDDSDEALQLFDLMAAPFFYSTQSIPKSFQAVIEGATGSQINSIMTRSYLQDKHSIPKGNDSVSYEGAISFGVPGIYRNLFKIDLNAMYPSIIRQYRLFDKEKDPKQHFLKMVDYFAIERTKNKQLYMDTGKEHFNHMQLTLKIFANSCYGFLGAPNLTFNSPKTAAEVTRIGREILKHSIKWATSNPVDYWLEKL